MKFSLCRAITFCNPTLISNHPNVCKTRLTTALGLFSDNNWLGSDDCDKVEREFKNLLANEDIVKSACKEFKRNQRLDHFWRDFLEKDERSQNLFNFLELVLILSHGQEFIERGFPINKECIIENQLPKSLVAQRQVYDGIRTAGGIDRLEVDMTMILSYRNARDLYGKALKKRKEEEVNDAVAAARKRALRDEIAQLRAKRNKLISEKTAEVAELNEQISSLMGSV